MQTLTRKAAASLGQNLYFTGLACKNGHVEPRYVSSGTCRGCIRDHNQTFARHKNLIAAGKLDSATFTGPPDAVAQMRKLWAMLVPDQPAAPVPETAAPFDPLDAWTRIHGCEVALQMAAARNLTAPSKIA